MTIFIFNTGTEGRDDATVKNALLIVDRVCVDLRIPRGAVVRDPGNDTQGGWFGFRLLSRGRDVSFHVPGDDPDEFCLGEPYRSRRMYVEGSSWFYGFGLSALRDRMER